MCIQNIYICTYTCVHINKSMHLCQCSSCYYLWLIAWRYAKEQTTCSFGLPQPFMFPFSTVIVSLLDWLCLENGIPWYSAHDHTHSVYVWMTLESGFQDPNSRKWESPESKRNVPKSHTPYFWTTLWVPKTQNPLHFWPGVCSPCLCGPISESVRLRTGHITVVCSPQQRSDQTVTVCGSWESVEMGCE